MNYHSPRPEHRLKLCMCAGQLNSLMIRGTQETIFEQIKVEKNLHLKMEKIPQYFHI